MIYNNEDGVHILEFGHGDIEVAGGIAVDPNNDEDVPMPCVVFTKQQPGEIGKISTEAFEKYGDSPTIRTDADTMLMFKNKESIDVLIQALQGIKGEILNEEN